MAAHTLVAPENYHHQGAFTPGEHHDPGAWHPADAYPFGDKGVHLVAIEPGKDAPGTPRGYLKPHSDFQLMPFQHGPLVLLGEQPIANGDETGDHPIVDLNNFNQDVVKAVDYAARHRASAQHGKED
ncbi:MAG TPA: hypothetical protein VMR45_02880 [Patescibacteria group bacterium]|nr:hypothetical protein [Patescibacteria group bacterium]